MVDVGIWGYVILIGVAAIVIYAFPKLVGNIPKAAETVGSLGEHVQLGRLRAQAAIAAERKRLEAEIKGTSP